MHPKKYEGFYYLTLTTSLSNIVKLTDSRGPCSFNEFLLKLLAKYFNNLKKRWLISTCTMRVHHCLVPRPGRSTWLEELM